MSHVQIGCIVDSIAPLGSGDLHRTVPSTPYAVPPAPQNMYHELPVRRSTAMEQHMLFQISHISAER